MKKGLWVLGMKNKNNKKMSYTARGTPSKRDQEARERLRFKPKRILIYGDMCKTPSNSGKLIYQLAKVMKARKHDVMTLGMKYNGIQMWDDDIPILPTGYCEECGHLNPSKRIKVVADYISYYNPDYFICVGNAKELQQFAIGNFDWSKMRATSVLYLTDIEYPLDIDSMKELKDKYNLKNPIKSFDKVVVMGEHDKKRIKEALGVDSSVIYPGIDLGYYKPITHEAKEKLREKYGYKKEDYLIYTFSKPNPDLIETLIPIMRKHQALHLNFQIQGKLDKYNSLMDRFKETHPDEAGRLTLMSTGYITSQSPEFYQMADLFLSLKESADLRIIEALACGIKTLCGGISVAAFNLSKALGFDDSDTQGLDLDSLSRLIDNCITNETDKNLNQIVDLLNKDYFGQFWANLIQNTTKEEEK